MEMIKNRRTIRKYAKKEVGEALLKTLLTDAMRTPTMGNLQLYSVVVTREDEAKARLAPAHFNQPMVTGASVVLTFCADFRRTSIWAENRKAVPGYDNFLSFLNAASDALLYCQTFTNLAEAEGLGTCYLGTTIYNPQAIIDTLKLPKLVMPIATLTVGYPDEMPAQCERLPIESIIHEEVYTDYTPESINRFYTEKENTEENKNFVYINKVETLAQIFTDIRYKKSDNEALSVNFMEALKQQGFL